MENSATDRRRFNTLQSRQSMKQIGCALLAALAAACDGCGRPPSTSDGVNEVYRTYCDAVVHREGAQAGALVSAGTLRRYHEFGDAALTADEETLAAIPVTARLQVLLLRQRTDAATLSRVAGPGVFAHIIEQGWLESAGFTGTQLGILAVDGDRAQAPVHRNGRPTRDWAYFLRENGAWKVNLLPNLTSADRLIEDAAAASQLSQKTYLESLVAEATKQPVRGDIWEPLQ